MSRKEIEKRINEILKRQENFALLLEELQGVFLEELMSSYASVVFSNSAYETFFIEFNQKYHIEVVATLMNDIISVIESNEAYFKEELGLATIEPTVKNAILKEFGITSAYDMGDGFLKNVWQSTGVKESVRSYLTKTARNELLNTAKEELRTFVKGNGETMGVYERFYYRSEDYSPISIFDSYQKADRFAQNTYAEQFELQASIYVGGTIAGTRPFCLERNGKVFLKDEIQSWENLTFAGKPKNGYQPFEDLGGYRCRHHLSWISNATAMRLDKTIKINDENRLYREV
jgi:hypothetical protein